ncbi:MAG: NAD-dependent succinate-semialdehyde dehydrogenase [Patescibacteria group bacterium]|nr:NAD-dependent succinate-semialdehyde dehydrogenase [Patescibacteria group bacterium]
MQTINPYTGEVEKTLQTESLADVREKLQIAEDRFHTWKKTSFSERKKLFKALIRHIEENKQHYAELNTREMGKPIRQSVGELEKCAKGCEFYAENAEKILAVQHVKTEAKHSYIRHDPLGVILAIMPWNFPFWQAMRAAAPAIMAGNVFVLKHASNVPQCSQALQDMFEASGFPKGVFTSIFIGSQDMEEIIADDRIAAVTVTGSEDAGRRIASIAGAHLKKCVLELGGSDPFIVLEDADMDLVVENAVLSRVRNTGQSCTAAKRFIVHKAVADEFVSRLTDEFRKLKIGDPMDPSVEVGPIAREDLLKLLDHQVTRSVAKGATLVTGGRIIDRKGYFYEPTILTNVRRGNPAFDEELFGPVAAITTVRNDEEAIRVANDTHLGLGASIWTENREHAQKLAAQIEAGTVFINKMVTSDPRLPTGGIKKSGYGRELGEHGIREFVNIKSVIVD